ncbi:MAG: DUF4013 domain-containing protein [Chloroflexota bacterium]
MNLGKAFTFVFDDENWIVKVLIGGVLSLIPIVGQILVFGYAIEVMKNVMRGASDPLPEWDDWGAKLVNGIMYFVISIVYALPIILLGVCFGLLMSLTGAAEAEEAATVLGSLGGICYGGFALVYGIFLALALPAALGRYLETGELGAAFRFADVWALVRANIGGWLIALVLSWLAGLVAGLGVILCFVGVLFTSFWSTLVMTYLWGDAYREASAGAALV